MRRPKNSDDLFWGDTLGGWVVFLLALTVFGAAFVNTVVDGRIFTMNADGRITVTAGGRVGFTLSALGLAATFAIAARALISARFLRARLISSFTWAMLAVLAWWSVTTLVRGDGPRSILDSAGQLFLAFAVIASPPTVRTARRLHNLLDIATIASFIVSFALPTVAQTECREDKCGIFGTMFLGLFEQENSASAAVILLLPACLTGSKLRAVFSIVLTGAFIAATGSRTSLIALAVVILFIAATLVLRRGDLTLRPSIAWRGAPVVFLLASLYILLTVSGEALTERGEIYEYIRNLVTSPEIGIIGPGQAPLKSMLDGWISGTHGVASKLLVIGGAPAIILAVLAFLGPALARTWTRERTLALGFLLAISARFLTEESLVLDARSVDAVVLIACIGWFAAPPRGWRGWVGAHTDDTPADDAAPGRSTGVDMPVAADRHRDPVDV